MISQEEIDKYLPKSVRYKSVTTLNRTILDTFLSELVLVTDYSVAANNTLAKLAPFGVSKGKMMNALCVWREKNKVHYLFKAESIKRPKKDTTLVKQELLSVAQLFYGQSDMTWEQLKSRLGLND